MEMLRSKDIDTRIHAFDLLFNLSIHINLFEEIKLEEDKSNPNDNSTSTAYKPMEMLQINLYNLLSDMLLCIQTIFIILILIIFDLIVILHRRETEPRVWQAALSLTLYFICNIGYILSFVLFYFMILFYFSLL